MLWHLEQNVLAEFSAKRQAVPFVLSAVATATHGGVEKISQRARSVLSNPSRHNPSLAIIPLTVIPHFFSDATSSGLSCFPLGNQVTLNSQVTVY
jgi:hypothetical protein